MNTASRAVCDRVLGVKGLLSHSTIPPASAQTRSRCELVSITHGLSPGPSFATPSNFTANPSEERSILRSLSIEKIILLSTHDSNVSVSMQKSPIYCSNHNSCEAFSASTWYFSEMYRGLSHLRALPSSILFCLSAFLTSTGVKDQKLLDCGGRVAGDWLDAVKRETRSARATVVASVACCNKVM